MYVEKKKGRYGVFYVLRAKESEIETVISDYEFLINKSLKEKYRDEFKQDTIRLLRKCKHDEKYDEDGEVSCILKDNDTWDFLHAAFNLLSCAGSVMKDIYGVNDDDEDEKFNEDDKDCPIESECE